MVTIIFLGRICTSGIAEQQNHAETWCVTNFPSLSFYEAALLKSDRSVRHKRFRIHKNLSLIDETITCKFSCVFRVHIVMLNNLAGRPMVGMQTQVGLKLFSNTSTPSGRETDNQAPRTRRPSLLL